MSAKNPLKVVLCWHMHQPHYFDCDSGEYQLPWTYLHATKDYVDMAALLESVHGARAVVNFAPTLIEQIDDYSAQIRQFLDSGEGLKDPLLAALVAQGYPREPDKRLAVIKACLRANRARLIDRFGPFKELAAFAELIGENAYLTSYADDQYIADMLTWYHLAWIGETVRRNDDRIKALMAKGHLFSLDDRRLLLTVMGELISSVIPRYRRLAEKGCVELSVTPYAHPIIPLMLEFESTREAMPEAPLPKVSDYPGGEERINWHVEEGLRVFQKHFGYRPTGCWPSEGSVSDEAVRVLGEAGFKWVASGESVLRHSLNYAHLHPGCIHRPYHLPNSSTHCYFRDDGLSDLIGFTYSEWHADDAVANFMHHLENIATACANEEDRVVSVILDGENAWEYYPENGYYFLTALYEKLANDPGIELTTFDQCIEAGIEAEPLPHLVAGSWVYGTFSTWIGDPDKNRGWELLVDAKIAFDETVAAGKLKGEALAEVERQLAICEGSDWFWWFGDYNPSDSVKDFDRLYRTQLRQLYRMLDREPPAELDQIISAGGGEMEAGGVMRRGKEAS